VVKPGDFLYNISSAVGATVADLLAANPELATANNLVSVGQVLR
jgi:LysM repeat protein